MAEGSSDRIRIRQYCPIGRQRPAVHVAMLGGGDRPRRRWPQDAEFPDQERRRRLMPEFFALFTRAFLRHDQTYTTSGEVVGAALWAPPGAVPVSGEDAEELGERIVELAGPDAPRFLGVNKLFDDHHPHGSYWYLQFLGVTPAWQGVELYWGFCEGCGRFAFSAHTRRLVPARDVNWLVHRSGELDDACCPAGR